MVIIDYCVKYLDVSQEDGVIEMICVRDIMGCFERRGFVLGVDKRRGRLLKKISD